MRRCNPCESRLWGGLLAHSLSKRIVHSFSFTLGTCTLLLLDAEDAVSILVLLIEALWTLDKTLFVAVPDVDLFAARSDLKACHATDIGSDIAGYEHEGEHGKGLFDHVPVRGLSATKQHEDKLPSATDKSRPP